MEHTKWYRDKVFYQIWPRSFRDGNGDGIGDLWGVYEKLDYLQQLGVDGVWFSPCIPPPGWTAGMIFPIIWTSLRSTAAWRRSGRYWMGSTSGE